MLYPNLNHRMGLVCVYVYRGPVVRVLLFNATGERDCAAMLKLLVVSLQRSYTVESGSGESCHGSNHNRYNYGRIFILNKLNNLCICFCFLFCFKLALKTCHSAKELVSGTAQAAVTISSLTRT